jgi:hypothetical protein
MITKIQAIQSLVPGAEVSVALNSGEVMWIKPAYAPVTDEEIFAEQRRLQSEVDYQEYRRNRAKEYPSIEEQLDALYHAGVFPPEMAERIKAVKIKYPRPELTQEEWTTQQSEVSTGATSVANHQIRFPAAPERFAVAPQKMTREEWLSAQTTPDNTNSSLS